MFKKIHNFYFNRQFNKKYDREAREEKLFRLLKSQAKYNEKKNKYLNFL